MSPFWWKCWNSLVSWSAVVKRAAVPTTGIQGVIWGTLDLMRSNERPGRDNLKVKDWGGGRERKRNSPERKKGKPVNCLMGCFSQAYLWIVPGKKSRNVSGFQKPRWHLQIPKFVHKCYNKGLYSHICNVLAFTYKLYIKAKRDLSPFPEKGLFSQSVF